MLRFFFSVIIIYTSWSICNAQVQHDFSQDEILIITSIHTESGKITVGGIKKGVRDTFRANEIIEWSGSSDYIRVVKKNNPQGELPFVYRPGNFNNKIRSIYDYWRKETAGATKGTYESLKEMRASIPDILYMVEDTLIIKSKIQMTSNNAYFIEFSLTSGDKKNIPVRLQLEQNNKTNQCWIAKARLQEIGYDIEKNKVLDCHLFYVENGIGAQMINDGNKYLIIKYINTK